VIVGAVGQAIRTAAGMESGWINSTVIVSPQRVMGPLASTVGDDWDAAGFRPVEVPGSAHYANRDRLYGYAVSGMDALIIR
jgi:hypothetical protein